MYLVENLKNTSNDFNANILINKTTVIHARYKDSQSVYVRYRDILQRKIK
jgi:hypothetical protein